MKKNICSGFVLVTIVILTINIFIKSAYLTDIIVFSVNLFIRNVFPSLFPMFIISYILIEIGIPDFLGSIFNKVFSCLFKCSGYSSFVFFMSMMTGFPSNAKYINDLINNEKIDVLEGEKILKFTFFSNPLFVINTVGISFFNNKMIGLNIFIALLIGNIITGLLFRNNIKSSKRNISFFSFKDLINRINNTNIFKTVLIGIQNSLETLINIFGILVFCLILIVFICKNPHTCSEIFISGVIEMTSGLKYLSISILPLNIKIIISTFFLAFGGFSIHAQIINILKEKKAKYLPFLKARIIHALISSFIIYQLYG